YQLYVPNNLNAASMQTQKLKPLNNGISLVQFDCRSSVDPSACITRGNRNGFSKPKTPDTRLGRQRLDLNQACSTRIPPRTEHVGRWNASALERFVTIRDGRTTHVSFHVRQPGAASTGRHMAAARTDRQVFRPDGADFCKLWRIAPDINELLPPHVSARQRKLNARIHVS